VAAAPAKSPAIMVSWSNARWTTASASAAAARSPSRSVRSPWRASAPIAFTAVPTNSWPTHPASRRSPTSPATPSTNSGPRQPPLTDHGHGPPARSHRTTRSPAAPHRPRTGAPGRAASRRTRGPPPPAPQPKPPSSSRMPRAAVPPAAPNGQSVFTAVLIGAGRVRGKIRVRGQRTGGWGSSWSARSLRPRHPPLTSAYAFRGVFAGNSRPLCVRAFRGREARNPRKGTNGGAGAEDESLRKLSTWNFVGRRAGPEARDPRQETAS
jgi:hypothetical protein